MQINMAAWHPEDVEARMLALLDGSEPAAPEAPTEGDAPSAVASQWAELADAVGGDLAAVVRLVGRLAADGATP